MEVKVGPGIYRYCKGKWIDQKVQYQKIMPDGELKRLREQANGNQRKVIKKNRFIREIITVDQFKEKNVTDEVQDENESFKN